ncbi:MAG TPA: acetate--CoA ligase family protein [Myxococcota bacterium]|nr:acetate--CoA ligase family protein [Myxococcota bacterium]HRY93185.1 acetate--CoA ligase family protein [Myxococcota bacterium]
MKPSELLSAARARGQTTLSEDDSRKVLEAYGLPLVPSRRVGSLDEAQAAARELGFPVALKGTGARLAHKTEADVVRLSLRDAAELEAAYRHVQQKGGELLEGMLVQRMLRSEREFVAGLSRDPQFGPCVMFGLGGIFTEVLQDVSFRVAPIETRDAEEMMDEIKGAKLLGPFRGKPAVDRAALAALLVALSRLGAELEAVAEVDINPILIDGSRPVAVDALVVVK